MKIRAASDRGWSVLVQGIGLPMTFRPKGLTEAQGTRRAKKGSKVGIGMPMPYPVLPT